MKKLKAKLRKSRHEKNLRDLSKKLAEVEKRQAEKGDGKKK